MPAGWSDGQSWTQVGELALAFLLSSMIGFEREVRRKSAGLRTYAIVGVSLALFLLISKYGFNSVLGRYVVLDPSRVAAQIVSGIGFIDGGIILYGGTQSAGLTTAATVWLTLAVGMACGAGLPLLAVTVTAMHFVITLRFPSGRRWLLRRWSPGLLPQRGGVPPAEDE
jgi:putative Mg2+ transporter-C (MgtC) family protein